MSAAPAGERLQKVLARSGVGSRRYCETLIAAGRVAVNGDVVRETGVRVDPDQDDIEVDGRPVATETFVYYLLNKPRGYLCSSRRLRGEKLAVDLVKSRGGERLFTVGRLDEESEGAVILTNDGEFCNRLTHPRYGVPKTYRVRVTGRADPAILERARRGVWLAEGRTASSAVQVVKRGREASELRVTLREGRNRHLRRVFARLGLPVAEITRLRVGGLSLGRLKPGEYRPLTPTEIRVLLEETTENQAPRGARRGPRGARG